MPMITNVAPIPNGMRENESFLLAKVYSISAILLMDSSETCPEILALQPVNRNNMVIMTMKK